MLLIEKHYPGFWQTMNESAVINLETLYGKIKLRTVLDDLGIGTFVRERWLHVAGNDANFTLRAILLSAIRHTDLPKIEGHLNKKMVKVVQTIGLDNVPDISRSHRSDTGKRRRQVTGKRNQRNTLKELNKSEKDGPWMKVERLSEVLDGLPDGCIERM